MMAEYRYQFSQILEKTNYDPDERDLIEQIASALYERYEELPELTELPESVRHFFVCYELNFQVGNGGFAQAAFNIPELFPLAKEAFEKFGLTQAAQFCDRALGMLPKELEEQIRKGVDITDSIEDVFQHFNESEMALLDDEIPDEFWVDHRLHQLVEENREEFLQMDRISD